MPGMNERRQHLWIVVVLLPWVMNGVFAWATWPALWNVARDAVEFVAKRLEIP
jgi:hypothetical protein